MFKVGDKVQCVNNPTPNRFRPDGGSGFEEGLVFTITYINEYPNGNVYFGGRNNNGVFEEYLIPYLEPNKGVWKKMKITEYAKKIKVGDKIRLRVRGLSISSVEGIVGELTNGVFYFWQNQWNGSHGKLLPQGYKYSHALRLDDHNIEDIEIMIPNKFTKKRKAYIEISKEVGRIFISLKIPEEVEEFFKNTSELETKESKTWLGKDSPAKFYIQPKELEKKLCEIDSGVFSDYGSGLMKDDRINVAIIRTVGASKGVKISSEGFNNFTNADLQDYIRRIGEYIKALWESNISSTRIKSVITFEI